MTKVNESRETAEARDGLHCVYETCRGMPCNPGCSFTMRPRPMIGLWAQLTPEQRIAALAYDGPQDFGDTSFMKSAIPVTRAAAKAASRAEDEKLLAEGTPPAVITARNALFGALKIVRIEISKDVKDRP